MKKIFLVCATVCMQQGIFAAQQNIVQTIDVGIAHDLTKELWRCLKIQPGMYTEIHLLKAIELLQKNDVDINFIHDEENNTPLQYVLKNSNSSHWDRQRIVMVYKWSKAGEINRSVQNNNGHTVLMLAVLKFPSLLCSLLESDYYSADATVPADFAIKNRNDSCKTLLDYAQGNPEVEATIKAYEDEYTNRTIHVLEQNTILASDIWGIIADYATPVNPHDIEADKLWEHEQCLSSIRSSFEQIDALIPEGY